MHEIVVQELCRSNAMLFYSISTDILPLLPFPPLAYFPAAATADVRNTLISDAQYINSKAQYLNSTVGKSRQTVNRFSYFL